MCRFSAASISQKKPMICASLALEVQLQVIASITIDANKGGFWASVEMNPTYSTAILFPSARPS